MEPLIGQVLPPGQSRVTATGTFPAIADARWPSAPLVHRAGSIAVALRGRPRLGDAPFHAGTIAARVLERYRDRGRACLLEIKGPFALAIVDDHGRSALLAIDRMGVESLSWAVAEGALYFASGAGAVARALPRPPAMNRQAIFDFMLAHMVPAPDTAYAGIQKLLAAHYLEWQDGRASIGRYWQPNFERVGRGDTATLAQALLPAIDRAVGRCEPDASTGSFLSGGLDSSTVTGLLVRQQPSAPAFSVGFGVDEFDELSYARIASEHFAATHHLYEVVPADIVDLVPRIAAAYDEPFGNSSAVPTYCCARLAKSQGIEHLLAGDGGDELFGGNVRYVRHGIFEAYARLPSAMRRYLLEPLARKLDPEEGLLPLRKFSSYVRQACVPLPDRFESWNMIYREMAGGGPQTIFDTSFLDAVDTDAPLESMRALWKSCPSQDLLDRMLWYDWKLTLADCDLPKVSRMCELAGIRVSYPMLDEDIVDLSVQVPSTAKIAGRNLRSFYKDAMRGFLPAETIAKEKHGFGLPFGQWLKIDPALQALARESLDGLKQRGIFNAAFVDRVADGHAAGHAGYFGYAIWDMLMLEQWLRAHAGSLQSG